MTNDDGPDPAPPASGDSASAATDDSPELLARRKLLARLSLGLGLAGAAAVGVPVVGFILAPLAHDGPRDWRPLGAVDRFEPGKTVNVVFVDASPLPWAGVTAKTGAWVRRVEGERFIAFSVNCAHLGCPVRWLDDARLFLCPCHGGVYYEDGTVAAGPPPHPLSQYAVRVRDGQVEIRTDPIPIG